MEESWKSVICIFYCFFQSFTCSRHNSIPPFLHLFLCNAPLGPACLEFYWPGFSAKITTDFFLHLGWCFRAITQWVVTRKKPPCSHLIAVPTDSLSKLLDQRLAKIYSPEGGRGKTSTYRQTKSTKALSVSLISVSLRRRGGSPFLSLQSTSKWSVSQKSRSDGRQKEWAKQERYGSKLCDVATPVISYRLERPLQHDSKTSTKWQWLMSKIQVRWIGEQSTTVMQTS